MFWLWQIWRGLFCEVTKKLTKKMTPGSCENPMRPSYSTVLILTPWSWWEAQLKNLFFCFPRYLANKMNESQQLSSWNLVTSSASNTIGLKVAKTEGFAARLRSVQILVLDEVDQLASVSWKETLEFVGYVGGIYGCSIEPICEYMFPGIFPYPLFRFIQYLLFQVFLFPNFQWVVLGLL